MNNITTHPKSVNFRVFSACALTFMMLISPLAPLASARGRVTVRPSGANRHDSSNQDDVDSLLTVAPPQPVPNAQDPNAPDAPSIVATLVDAFDDSVVPNGKAEPGQTITYTATITNNGPDPATAVQFTLNADTDTSLVPGSIQTQPIANPDAFNVIGNVRIQPNAAQGLLANDIDPDTGNNTGLTATAQTISSTQCTGGCSNNVTINTDGSFSYNPPAGFTGADTFTYTITDTTSKTDTAVATLQVGNGTSTPGTNVIWFVNPAAGAGGDGRLTNPFNCYTGGGASCFSQTAADDAGDTIFLFNGALTGGYALLANQKLVGQGASATLLSITGFTLPTASDALPVTNSTPSGVTITTTNVNAIPLPTGAGNAPLLRGFTVGNTGTGAKITGATFGTLTVGNNTTPDMVLNGTGQALNLSSGTFAASSAFASVATSSSAAQGINLAGIAGTVSFGSTTVSGSTTQGILIGTTTANINFGNTSVSGGTDGVSLQNNSSGTRTFGTLAISNNSGVGFLSGVGGGNVNVTGGTLIPQVALTAPVGTAIDIQDSNANLTFAGVVITKGNPGTGVFLDDNATRSITFSSLDITTSNGAGITATDGGNLTVTNAAGSSINATGGPALSVGGTGLTLDLDFTTLTSTNSSIQGIFVDASTGTLTVNNGAGLSTSIQNSTGNGIHLNNSGTFSFGNTQVNLNGGIGVLLAGNGTTTFADLDITPDSGVAAFVTNSNGQVTTTSGTIVTTSAAAVSPTSTPLAMVLDSVTANNAGGGGPGINITTSSGSLGIAAGSLTGGASPAFSILGGTVAVTYSGGMTQAGVGALTSITGGHSGGTITFNTGTLSATNGTGIQFSNADGTYNFNGTTTLGGGDAGVDILADSAGTFNFVAATTITSPTGIAFNVAGSPSTSTCNVTYNGNITQANNAAMVNVSDHNTGTITFTGTLNATNGTGLQFSNADSTMSYNFNGTTTLNGGDAGVDILAGSNGNFTFTSGTTITNPSGTSFNIDGGTGNVTYNGTITDDVGRLVAIANTTGGTKDFTGAITDNNDADGGETGISLTTNGGATINFRGGLVIRTTNQPAFTATGGGTLNICDESPCAPGATGALINTLRTDTATALNVANTNIGVNKLEFQSVSAGLAASGPTNGIILNTTGANGLEVKGTGTTAGSGGTIQRTAQGALFTSTSNLVLKNMNFTNANSGEGTVNNIDGPTFNNAAQAAINMSSVSTVTFDNLQMTNPAGVGSQVGINGNVVSNLTITGSTVTAFGNEANENNMRLFNLTGTCSITNSTFSFSEDSNVDIRNNTGTLNLTVQGNPLGTSFNNFTDTQTKVNGNGGLFLTAVGASSVINATFKSNNFLRIKTVGIAVFARDNGTVNIDITGSGVNANGNTFDVQGGIGRAIDLNAEDTADVNFNITNNPRIWSNAGPGINIFGINDGNFHGRINNNPDIRQGGVNTAGSAIFIHPEDNADGRFEVIGNTISALGNDTGILVLNHGDGAGPVDNGRIDATIRQNNITLTDQFVTGIETRAGTNDGDDNDVCANIGTTTAGTGNTVNLGPFAGDNVAYLARVGNNDGARLFLEGFTTSVNNTWNIRNNMPLNSTLEFHAGGATPPLAPPGGVCLTPTNPVAMSLPIIDQKAPEYASISVPASSVATQRDLSHVSGGFSAEIAMVAGVTGSAEIVPPSAVSPDNHATVTADARNRERLTRRASSATEFESVAPVPTLLLAEARPLFGDPSFDGTKKWGNTSLRYSASDTNSPLNNASYSALQGLASQLANSQDSDPPNAPNGSGGTVLVNIGTLAANDSVTISFQVVVDNPFTDHGTPHVNVQGTVSGSNFANVLTDDPAAGGATDQTVTLINMNEISVKDAKQIEPASGTRDMVFTVTLSQPALTGGVTVNFTTADEPAGPGKAVAGICGSGGDYTSTNGQVAFATGEQVKSINVPICSDAVVEPDETFLVNLSGNSNGAILDAQAVGTITANTPGTLLISELRHRGPMGANDDFVELYNNTNSAHVVTSSDASAGYGLFKMGANCSATPVLVGIIPNTTNIPARGHFLLTGSAYSLANYGGTGVTAGNAALSPDIEDDRNIAVFTTTNVANISSATRLDAVGFGLNIGGVCDLLREPSTLGAVGALDIEYSYFRKQNGFPIDTNSNLDDFVFADTVMTNIPGIPRQLGAPGPENLAAFPVNPALPGSPIHGVGVSALPALDTTKASAAIPNQDRDFINAGPNAPNGSLYIRRRFANNTGSTITRLRFRIFQMTTGPTPALPTADLRALTSSGVTVSGVTDATTCAHVGTPTTVPCQVSAQATVLEEPPTQANGGGLNATLSVAIPGGVTTSDSVAVEFKLGIVQGGNFTLGLLAETLPGSTAGVVFTGNTESGPTSSNSSVTGRIVDRTGTPIEGAVVRLEGTQNRKFITDANGFYRFDGVQTGGFYTVTPSRANYTFSPADKSFTQTGESTEAAFGATLLSSGNLLNPLDTPEYFVRQHYLDFLGREPDEAGFNFWSDQILECGNDLGCIERRRENVSAAYFLSIEFQKTGGLVDGVYRASYGARPSFAEFMPDTRAVGLGVRVGDGDWETTLNLNKEAFVTAFVDRAAFQAKYAGMDNTQYVDTLIGNTGVAFASTERGAWLSGLATGTMTRADVLRSIAEHERFMSAKFNETFVMMEYFGYLRRDPDAGGFAFWLNKLNEFNGNFQSAEMVKAFIVSGEYRSRFPR